jgi:hypothetical protein
MADKTQKPFSEAIKGTQINYTTWFSDSQMQRAFQEMKLNVLLEKCACSS